MNKLPPYKIINSSGLTIPFNSSFPIIKQRDFRVIDQEMDGDAPKDFIQIYDHENSRRNNQKSWIPFIAKVGHKYYPNESIAEYLLFRIGDLIWQILSWYKLEVKFVF